MTPDQMLARISQLEAFLAQPTRVVKARATKTTTSSRKAERAAEKARRAQFKLEAFKRNRLHCSLNRYTR